MRQDSPFAFRSEVDTWLWVVTVLSFIGPIGWLLWMYLAGGAPGLQLLALSPLLFGASMIALWIMKSTYYVLEEKVLSIHSGPFHWDVPYGDISTVRATDDLSSSPALSSRRLEILYGDGQRILISPEERQRFLLELGNRINRPGVVR